LEGSFFWRAFALFSNENKTPRWRPLTLSGRDIVCLARCQ